MVIFTSIPKWAQTLFGNGLVTEPSPFGNRDPFLWGSPYRNGYPFYLLPHMEMGVEGETPFSYGDVSIPISIW